MKTCAVCRHPKRDSIDHQLLEGDSLRSIAVTYSISKSALQRHRSQGHLNIALVRSASPNIIASNDGLLDQLRDLHARTLSLLSQAEESRDGRMALAAVREARCNVELLAKLEFILADRAATKEKEEAEATAIAGQSVSEIDYRAELLRKIQQFNGERVQPGITANKQLQACDDYEIHQCQMNQPDSEAEIDDVDKGQT